MLSREREFVEYKIENTEKTRDIQNEVLDVTYIEVSLVDIIFQIKNYCIKVIKSPEFLFQCKINCAGEFPQI